MTGLVLAALAAQLLLTSPPLAADWFAGLRWTWSEPAAHQRHAAVVLLSDRSSFVTGVMLPVDGGALRAL